MILWKIPCRDLLHDLICSGEMIYVIKRAKGFHLRLIDKRKKEKKKKSFSVCFKKFRKEKIEIE